VDKGNGLGQTDLACGKEALRRGFVFLNARKRSQAQAPLKKIKQEKKIHKSHAKVTIQFCTFATVKNKCFF
jgi:hypothetical protein